MCTLHNCGKNVLKVLFLKPRSNLNALKLNLMLHIKSSVTLQISINIRCFVPNRGVVEDTRLEAKDTKKFRGQGQGQTLSRPRTKDTGASVLQKKEGLQKKFSSDLKKKVFKNFFQTKKVFKNFFSGDF